MNYESYETRELSIFSCISIGVIVSLLASFSYFAACYLFGADINPIVAVVLAGALSLSAYRRATSNLQEEFECKKPVKG